MSHLLHTVGPLSEQSLQFAVTHFPSMHLFFGLSNQ